MSNETLVSIVILTKNGGELLQESIRVIFQQVVPFSFEVIIVDSGSLDDTINFLNKYPVRLYKIPSSDFSFGPTRDFGFSKATGTCIVTLSQDVVPKNNNWLLNLVTPILNNQADVVQGCDILPDNKKIFFWERKGLFFFTSERRLWENWNNKMPLSFTNIAIRKEVWKDNKFDKAPVAEDKYLQKKLSSGKYRIIYKSDAGAYHGHNYDFSSLLKRISNQGFGYNYLGYKYSFLTMLKDLFFSKNIHMQLLRGIKNQEIVSLGELLFPVLRPVWFFIGNRFQKRYIF